MDIVEPVIFVSGDYYKILIKRHYYIFLSDQYIYNCVLYIQPESLQAKNAYLMKMEARLK